MAAIPDGSSRSEDSRFAGMTLQIVPTGCSVSTSRGSQAWRPARPVDPVLFLMTTIVVRWQRLSGPGRYLLSTEWCAGGSSIWCNGYNSTTTSPSTLASLEQPHQSALEHYVHRHAPVVLSVDISEPSHYTSNRDKTDVSRPHDASCVKCSDDGRSIGKIG